MKEPKLPNNLQHLRNIIDNAKGEPNHFESMLRTVVKTAAEDAPAAAIFRLAELILQMGIEVEQAKHARYN